MNLLLKENLTSQAHVGSHHMPERARDHDGLGGHNGAAFKHKVRLFAQRGLFNLILLNRKQ